jgi:NTP pyrophosphatase (non-canonical NTP hydrolase)
MRVRFSPPAPECTIKALRQKCFLFGKMMIMNDDSDQTNLQIGEYQDLIKRLVVERGFDKETVPEVFTLLVEEIGELAKAIRKRNGQKVDTTRRQHDVEEEVADVFWLLLDLCNRLEIDLGTAFALKEKINASRQWE